MAAGILVCVCVDLHELLDAWRQRGDPETPIAPTDARPFVSIHVPIRAEPPAIVARTLRALAALDYDYFEVLIVSNNTPDPALWQPVEQLCVELGERFRFFDIPSLAGFKAGALNFALRQTSDAASVICSLDSDYEVRPDYLRRFVSSFGDPRVVFVQCPQDYRDWQADPFLRMCYWEYWQFFGIGMVLRTRRNAAMLHGTMAMVRKGALVDAGGWAEWCLTEDAECGTRLLRAGGVGLYTTQSFGQGLIPFGYGDYIRQRRRWVIGGAQQMRRHLRLFLLPGGLSLIQRYLIVRSWAPWLRDACIVAALPIVVISGLVSWLFARPSTAPMLCVALMAVLGSHALRQWLISRVLFKLSWRDTARAACAVVALTWTIGHSWWRGIIPWAVPYFRTPKEAVGRGGCRFEARAESAVALTMTLLVAVLLARSGETSSREILALVLCVVLIAPASFLAWASHRSLVARDRAAGLQAKCTEITVTTGSSSA